MAGIFNPTQVPRYDETFPELKPEEIDRLRRYGTLRKYSDGEKLVEAGKIAPGMFVVLKGLVDGTAEGDVEALVVPTSGLRALLVAEAQLGERIMRALILRRVALLRGG